MAETPLSQADYDRILKPWYDKYPVGNPLRPVVNPDGSVSRGLWANSPVDYERGTGGYMRTPASMVQQLFAAGPGGGGRDDSGGRNGGGGTPAPFSPSGGTVGQQDAFAYISGLLKQYDLPSSLSQWAWGELLKNRSQSQVALELLDQPAYHDRFGKVVDARRAAGLPPVSAGEIISYENSWSQIARAGGLPGSFQGRDVAQDLMANNVSAAEASDRVQRTFVQVTQAPVEVRSVFDAYFGANSDAALAALFLDPDRALPDLERQVAEAQIGGSGTQHGFNFDEALARRLAAQGIGFDEAQRGFGLLESQRPLFEQTISESSGLSERTGIEAQFNLGGGSAEEVRRRSEARRAAYAGGSSAAEGQSGIYGAGSARQV